MSLVLLLIRMGLPAFPSQVEQWRGTVALYAGDVPVNFALKWLWKESGGQLGGSQCGDQGAGFAENGLFQLSEEEAAALGITGDSFDALCTDPNWSVQAGIELIQYHMRNASKYLAALGQSWGSPDYWKLVKLCHGAGTGYCQWALSQSGGASWAALVQVSSTQASQWYSVDRQIELVNSADEVGAYAPSSVGIGGALLGLGGLGLLAWAWVKYA